MVAFGLRSTNCSGPAPAAGAPLPQARLADHVVWPAAATGWLLVGLLQLAVMLVVIGKALADSVPPRAYRRPLSEVVHLETMSGASLGA